MKRLWIVLILVGMLMAAAACQSSAPQASGQQQPRQDDSFFVLNAYKDASGRFTMDVPMKWNVQPQRLAQDNMKVATAFVGPDGFASVTQFDFGKAPGEQADQLLDAFLQVTGVTQNKDYRQLARLPVSPTQGKPPWKRMNFVFLLASMRSTRFIGLEPWIRPWPV